MLHGSQGRRPPTLTVGEGRARGCSAQPWASLGSGNTQGLRERRIAIVRSHRAGDNYDCLEITVPGVIRTELQPQVGAQGGGGDVDLWFAPAIPQQTRSSLTKPQTTPLRLKKCCKMYWAISRSVSCLSSIALISNRFSNFTEYKGLNPNPGTPRLRFLIPISTAVPPVIGGLFNLSLLVRPHYLASEVQSCTSLCNKKKKKKHNIKM